METFELYYVAGNILLAIAVCFGPYLVSDMAIE